MLAVENWRVPLDKSEVTVKREVILGGPPAPPALPYQRLRTRTRSFTTSRFSRLIEKAEGRDSGAVMSDWDEAAL